jgi:hypothetical protein
MTNVPERDYEDEVYEDDYYEEHFDEEELIDEEEVKAGEYKELEVLEEEGEREVPEYEPEEGAESWDKDKDNKVDVSYACEDCDYRWEDVIIKSKENLDDFEETEVVCPMCGSTNITQI